jgi:microcystin-dependent protein
MSNIHDYDVGNAVGATFRADLNNCLSEIQATNRGANEPATKVNGKLWVNSSNNTLNIYDGTNFITLGKVDTAEMGHATTASPSFTGTVTSAGDIVLSGTGKIKVPTGTTAQRPSGVTGDFRFNTTLTQFEGYDGSSWAKVGGVPAGTVIAYASSTVPSGFLECNGSNISRSTYAQLYSAIGNAWGSGDGSSTFGLPDLRGEFIRGWDRTRGVDASRGFATTQSSQNQQHNHAITDPSHSHNMRGLALSGGSGSVSITLGSGQSYQIGYSNSISSRTSGNSSTGISINNQGGSESRPRNVSLMYIIKF